MGTMRKFLLLLALTLPLAAKDLTTITVHVTNQAGKGVGNAGVRIKFVAGRSAFKGFAKVTKSWEMRSSLEGFAKIPPIPKGTILVQVIAKNYQTFGQTFEVQEDDRTIEVVVNPPQEQYSAH